MPSIVLIIGHAGGAGCPRRHCLKAAKGRDLIDPAPRPPVIEQSCKPIATRTRAVVIVTKSRAHSTFHSSLHSKAARVPRLGRRERSGGRGRAAAHHALARRTTAPQHCQQRRRSDYQGSGPQQHLLTGFRPRSQLGIHSEGPPGQRAHLPGVGANWAGFPRQRHGAVHRVPPVGPRRRSAGRSRRRLRHAGRASHRLSSGASVISFMRFPAQHDAGLPPAQSPALHVTSYVEDINGRSPKWRLDIGGQRRAGALLCGSHVLPEPEGAHARRVHPGQERSGWRLCIHRAVHVHGAGAGPPRRVGPAAEVKCRVIQMPARQLAARTVPTAMGFEGRGGQRSSGCTESILPYSPASPRRQLEGCCVGQRWRWLQRESSRLARGGRGKLLARPPETVLDTATRPQRGGVPVLTTSSGRPALPPGPDGMHALPFPLTHRHVHSVTGAFGAEPMASQDPPPEGHCCSYPKCRSPDWGHSYRCRDLGRCSASRGHCTCVHGQWRGEH